MRFRVTIDVDLDTSRQARAWMRRTVRMIERETRVSCELPTLEPLDENGDEGEAMAWWKR